MSSFSLWARTSSTSATNWSVSFWSSFSALRSSSSEIVWSRSSLSSSSLWWRRTLRTATRASSPRSRTSFARSRRRSSVSGGKARRMTMPSFEGWSPRSEDWMAFSMAPMADRSKGWITRSRGSGTEIDATSLRTDRAPFIFLRASSSEVSTVTPTPSPGPGRSCGRPLGDEGPDVLPHHHPLDVPLPAEVEHDDRKGVLAAQGDRGGVHDLQPQRQELGVADGLEAMGAGLAVGVGVVHAVDLRALQDGLGPDLEGPLGGGGVGREVGRADACGEDDDAPLLQVPDGPQGDVWLGDLRHVDGRLDPGRHAELLQRVLERERVHHGREHAHVVGPRPVDAGSVTAPPDVAATDHHGHLHAERRDLL